LEESEVERQENDRWDIAESVGATATMAAAARAAATRRSDRLIDDPLAEVLVRAVGIDFFTGLASGARGFDDVGTGWITDLFAVRARYFDDFIACAWRAGIRQVVNVGAGLDTRGYRLTWPAHCTLYEVDRPEVLWFKASTLTAVGVAPVVRVRTVGIDLREDWPTALQANGFDAAQPTAWLAEGLLIGYLPAAAQDRLLDDITDLSATGSRLVADSPPPTGHIGSDMREVARRWRSHGLAVDLTNLFFQGRRNRVDEYLQSRNWTTCATGLTDVFNDAGLDEAVLDPRYTETALVTYLTARRARSDSRCSP
jgi:methyltransferase (TIGR00027 family)